MIEISIVIPVHNMESYLKKCLDSVLNQTFENYEIIAVDDGSTDNSGRILDTYKKLYPSVTEVIHQKNKGLGGARNTGIDSAKGKYLFFLDSDDWLSPMALEHSYELAEKNKAEMVIFDSYVVNEKGIKTGYYIGGHCKDFTYSLETYPQLLFEYPCAWNKLYHRDLFLKSKIRYPEKAWYEDLRTSSKLYIKAKKIVNLREPLYNYLQRNDSIMHNCVSDRNIEILEAIDDIMDYYTSMDLNIKYKSELEFLAIKHVLLSAVPRIVRTGSSNKLLWEMQAYMDQNFPRYVTNAYLETVPFKEKVKFKLVNKNCYQALFILYMIRERLYNVGNFLSQGKIR